jgi:hypothetical protein
MISCDFGCAEKVDRVLDSMSNPAIVGQPKRAVNEDWRNTGSSRAMNTVRGGSGKNIIPVKSLLYWIDDCALL